MTSATNTFDMGGLQGASTNCPLCQKAFDPTCATCTPACPLAKGCNALTCPHCGYSFPKPTRLSGFLARFFAGRARARNEAAGGAKTLAQVPTGSRVRVTGVRADEASRLSKLAAFGIVEGCELYVRQRHPALVIEIGETTLALDGDVARALIVSPATT